MSSQYTFQILEHLADGLFHSGEALAKHFGISRTTVWEAIQEAQALGVEIFSVRGRGYRLPSQIEWLERARIQSLLGDARTTLNLIVHDTLPSTNGYLMQQAAQGAPHGTCAIARVQTQGKGRRGRVWQASLGSSLTFSLLWRFEAGASALSGLSLAIGVGLMRGLHALGVDEARLKWPNDVLIGGRKVGGILIELQGDMDGPSAAVIGIGINLAVAPSLKAKIDQPFTDLASQLGDDAGLSANQVLGTLLKHTVAVLVTFEQEGFAALSEEWSRHHYYQQKAVTLLMPDGSVVNGVAEGIEADGALRVHTDSGSRRFVSGEISLRGAGV